MTDREQLLDELRPHPCAASKTFTPESTYGLRSRGAGGVSSPRSIAWLIAADIVELFQPAG